jgi:type II secretory ATPase GspE/PulE/Tfp pilus assembly ATPase PilB-like protein/FixJ family two-component response regulator
VTKPAKGYRLPAAPVADHRLLEMLKRVGKIDAAAMSRIERAMSVGSSAVDAVIQAGAMAEYDLARAISTELHLPLLDMRANPPDDSGASVLTKSTAQHYGLVPVKLQRDVMVVAMANPYDHEALRSIESSARLKLQPVVAPRSHIVEAMESLYKGEASLDVLLAEVPMTPALEVVKETTENLDPHDVQAITREAEQPPIVKMVNLILYEAFNARASDVHIEPGPNVVLVRFRIDGVLEDHLQIPKWVQGPIVARIKVMAKLDITERRVPQDGHLGVRVRGDLVDIRVSSMPTTDGEKIVMRLLDPANGPRRLSEVGMSAADLATLQSVIQRPEGMILVTGPTGSGKTTTLYAIIQELLSPTINIVTIENPVEYEMKGVSQISINEKQGLGFATVLRSVLRQDPDVILVGEIRDRETAEIAFQAAQTGHLVLSTLHTNDAVATVTRLFELGIDPQVMAPSLLAVVAQRLVRKVCLGCGEPASADAESAHALHLPADKPLRAGRGCAECRNTGFAGRTGCYEVLRMTKPLQQLIEQKSPETAIRAVAEEEGMTQLADDARAKIVSGVTTPAEVLRVVEVVRRGPSCPSCRHPVEATFSVCPFCRAVLRKNCSGCGVELKKKWTACPFCGVEVTQAPSPAPRSPGMAAASQEVGAFQVPKILAVDDDGDVLELVRLTLKRSPFPVEVDIAEGGQDALAKIGASRPHLVILDLMMPGMDGYEVCRRLRSDLSTAFIPVLMLTALADSDSKRLAFLAGTDDYVVKPFDLSELHARVQRLLERTYGWSPPVSPQAQMRERRALAS